MRRITVIFLVSAGLQAGVAFAEPLPALQLTPPSGWSRAGAGDDPAAYLAPNSEAELDIYPFRSYGGDFRKQFRETLLRELVPNDRRELKIVGTPQIEVLPVAGSEAAMFGIFVDDRSGTRFPRLRVAVLAGGAVALVDYSAPTLENYQRHWPAVLEALQAMSVAKPRAAARADTPAPSSAGGGKFRAGLYLAQIRRNVFRADFSGRSSGSWEWVLDTEFYLFSEDGRVHRGYGLPEPPGGDIKRFDYQKAQRAEPGNAGTYAAQGARVTISLGGSKPETIEAQVLAGEQLDIRKTTYKRAQLK